MKSPIVVAIDGPAGSGKSSVAREIAMELGLKYIDSGAIYRSITWFMLKEDEHFNPDSDFETHLKGFSVKQEFLNDGNSITSVNGTDVSRDIRDERITKRIGTVSDNIEVREFVTNLLRSWSMQESIIMDGRDIGSVVLPGSDLKIYLDASVDVRAKRRAKEYSELGKNVDENVIKTQIVQRDIQDKGRKVGALIKADDAFYLDTSDMTKADVIKEIKRLILEI